MKKNPPLLLLLLFAGLNLQAQSIDLRMLDAINGPVARGDAYWSAISNSAFFINIGTPVALFAAGEVKSDHELVIKSYETAGALLIAGSATFLMKNSIQRERPFYSYPEVIVKKGDGGGFSFPSGHTSMSFASATSLSLAFKKWYVTVPAFTYASAVGYSRMYLGVHYPSDVLAGALVGCGSAYLSFHLQKWLSDYHRKKKSTLDAQ